MRILIDTSVTHMFDKAIRHEWLETNGLGGYASSTIINAHTRRYHGLLVAAMRPPGDRKVLLSKMDEAIIANGSRYEWGCNKYQHAIHPQGYIFLRQFEKGTFPQWTYKTQGITLKKTIAAVNGENTTLILYEVLEADQPFRLELTPLAAYRGHHELQQAFGDLVPDASFASEVLRVRMRPEVPEVYIQVPGASFEKQQDWYYKFEYIEEKNRAYPAHEDLYSPGKLGVDLGKGGKLGIIVSTGNPEGRDAFALFRQEKKRREKILSNLKSEDRLSRQLTLAADQFVVRKNTDAQTILAGYPWFAESGRAALISLPGICLTTGRFDDARKILEGMAKYLNKGMIPNQFSEQTGSPSFHAMDTSLWFFIALYAYFKASGDKQFVEEMLPVMGKILQKYKKGSSKSIKVDKDGLLYGEHPGVPLSWMDGQTAHGPVTVRNGKPVEVNALWYNALRIYAEFNRKLGHKTKAASISRAAGQVKRRFMKTFWNPDKQCLFDCVHPYGPDPAIRPNQLFALSLPFALVSGPKAHKILRVVDEELYTPTGIRTLSPVDTNYEPVYGGNADAREKAAHQGAAWAWLLGPYIDAHIRLNKELGARRAVAILRDIEWSIHTEGTGTVSELFDGQSPHAAKGCMAYAMSVGELLRVITAYQIKVPRRIVAALIEEIPYLEPRMVHSY